MLDLAAFEAALAGREAPPIGRGSRQAAVAVVLRPAEGDVEALLIRRAERENDPWSGHMAFPGGRIDPGDADARSAAVREVAEEVGLDLGAVGRCLGRLEEHRALGVVRPLLVTPFVFALDDPATPLVLDPREVAGALWVPLSRLSSGELAGVHVWRYRGVPTLRLPCWNVDGRTIWGLTHRILSTLLGLIVE